MRFFQPTSRCLTIFSAFCIAMTVAYPVVPAQAGWTPDGGVNWCGTWASTWGGPAGGPWYGNLSVNCLDGRGSYPNGVTEGTFYYVYDTFGTVSGLRYQGVWRRTAGNSGGPCQYGQFALDLSSDNAPNTRFYGNWTYCNDDATNPLARRWLWMGNEIR